MRTTKLILNNDRYLCTFEVKTNLKWFLGGQYF